MDIETPVSTVHFDSGRPLLCRYVLTMDGVGPAKGMQYQARCEMTSTGVRWVFSDHLALALTNGKKAVLEALRTEDARQAKLHDLIQTIREQIRLEVLPEHRPDGLMQNIQNAVYAMRGRTNWADNPAIIEALK